MAYDRIENDLLEKLVAVYPQTFFLNQADRRPLKIGVHHDLTLDTARHGLSRDELRKALVWYCSSPGYAAATVLNAPRIDLAGEPDGTVTAEAVSAAVKVVRLSQKPGRERREIQVEEGAVAVTAVAPEQQTEKAAAPEPASGQNGKRVSLSDLRTAARQRLAAQAR